MRFQIAIPFGISLALGERIDVSDDVLRPRGGEANEQGIIFIVWNVICNSIPCYRTGNAFDKPTNDDRNLLWKSANMSKMECLTQMMTTQKQDKSEKRVMLTRYVLSSSTFNLREPYPLITHLFRQS